MFRWFAGAVLALMSCSGNKALELPTAGGQSYIIAFSEIGSTAWTVGAQTIDQRTVLTGVPDDARLIALVYAQDLAALGVAPGLVEETTSCARPCELLRPVGAFEAVASGGTANAWRDASIPEDLAVKLVPDKKRCESACATLDIKRINLGVLTRVAFSVRESDDAALVMLQNGRLIRVHRSGDFETVCLEGQPSIAGFGGPEVLWSIGSTFGSIDIAAADPTQPCPFRAAPTPPGQPRWLDGPPNTEPLEAFAMSASGAFARFDGNTWLPLVTVQLSERDRRDGLTVASRGTVAWIRSMEGLGSVGSEEVAILDPVRGLTVQTISVDVEVSKPRIESSGRSKDGKTILGLDNTGLVFPRGSGWAAVAGRMRNFDRLGFIVDLGPRILFGSRSVISQYVEGYGYCEDTTLSIPVIPKSAARITSSDLLVGDLSASDLGEIPSEVLWIETHDCAAQQGR